MRRGYIIKIQKVHTYWAYEKGKKFVKETVTPVDFDFSNVDGAMEYCESLNQEHGCGKRGEPGSIYYSCYQYFT